MLGLQRSQLILATTIYWFFFQVTVSSASLFFKQFNLLYFWEFLYSLFRYVFAFYLIQNNITKLFEDNQSDLELATEQVNFHNGNSWVYC